MAGNWNPNAPGALGLEWAPTIPATQPVRSTPTGFLRFRSTTAETIGALQPYVTSDPTVTQPLFTIFEIFGAGNEITPTGASTVNYAPSQDDAIGDWVTNTGATTNLFQKIDEPVVYPVLDPNDYIQVNSTHTPVDVVTPYSCRVASSGFSSNARVYKIAVLGVDAAIGSVPGATSIHYGLKHTSGAAYVVGKFNTNIFSSLREVDCGEINPITLLPWTAADIQSFSSGTWFLRVSANNANSGNTRTAVYTLALKVYYLPVENRVAAATWQRPSGAVSATPQTDALIKLPAGTANWAKPASGDFTATWRKANDKLVSGTQTVATDIGWQLQTQQFAETTTFPPVPGMAGGTVSTSPSGIIINTSLVLTATVPTLSLAPTGGGVSNDSQPYEFITGIGASAVSGTPAAQRITPAANRSYLGVKFSVRPPAGNPTLTVTINRVSDNAQIGGSFVIDANTARTFPVSSNGIYRVNGFLNAGAALISGTQYEILFSPSSSDVWVLYEPQALNAATASFAGTTDTARLGGTILTDRDLEALIFEQPAAPSNLTTRILAQPQDPAKCFCAINTIDQVLIQWTRTELGTFARYEVQRLNECSEWEPLYRLLSQNGPANNPIIVSIVDYEAPRNRPVKYRVRVVGTDGSFSAWAETPFVTPLSYGAEIIFTSNANPSLQVAYDRVPSEDFGFIDHAADEIIPIYGTNYQVAFMEPEDRGVARSITVYANAVGQPLDANLLPIGGVDVFFPLRRISRAGLPYVCVLDYQANRTLAHIQLSGGNHKEPRNMYLVDVAYTPVTGSTIEVTIP